MNEGTKLPNIAWRCLVLQLLNMVLAKNCLGGGTNWLLRPALQGNIVWCRFANWPRRSDQSAMRYTLPLAGIPLLHINRKHGYKLTGCLSLRLNLWTVLDSISGYWYTQRVYLSFANVTPPAPCVLIQCMFDMGQVLKIIFCPHSIL